MGEMIKMLKEDHMFEVFLCWYFAKKANELEVFPCYEFRVAYEEAIKYGGRVILGDRPLQITIKRAWSKMPLWYMTKLLFYPLFFKAGFSSSSFDLNKLEMNDNNVPLAIQKMSKDFPTLMKVLVDERDQYMSCGLLKAASESRSVVAVVGAAHLQGIKKNWKQPVMMKDLMTVPSPKRAISTTKVFTSVGVIVAGVAIISNILRS